MYFHSASVASQLDFNSDSAYSANNGNYSLSSWLGGGFREKPMLNLGKKKKKTFTGGFTVTCGKG